MNSVNNKKIITLCFIAGFLFFISIVTCGITFSLSSNKNSDWNITINSISGSINNHISGTSALVDSNLDINGEDIITLKINNKGNYNAYLNDYSIEVLNKDIKSYLDISIDTDQKELPNNSSTIYNIKIKLIDSVPDDIKSEYLDGKLINYNIKFDYQQML